MNLRSHICFILLGALMFISCEEKHIVTFDEYSFAISKKLEENRDKNNENVLLSLGSRDGVVILIQNKINILASYVLSRYKGYELLSNMHTYKFASYMKTLKGYDTSEVEFGDEGKVIFTKQTFKYKEEGVEINSDIRIVQLDTNYYAFYTLVFKPENKNNFKVVDKMIKSLNDRN